MPDPRFFATNAPLSIADAAAAVGADNSMVGEGAVNRVAALSEDDLSAAVVFCEDKAACNVLEGRAFGLCLTTATLAETLNGDGEALSVASPRAAFAVIAERLHYSREEKETNTTGEARIDPAAHIHPTAHISADAEIGARARIGAFCHIGRGVAIGEDALIEPHVSITHARIGRGGHILSGARIGQAGFGYVETPEGLSRVPQLGRVIIGDNVDIGANSAIDRGALSDTLIGDNTKIDNLVQIGHNTRIGRYCVIAGLAGISGSCVLGDGVKLGGQVGVADHITIGDGAQVGAQSGLMRDVPAGGKVLGTPARPARAFMREVATIAKLAKKKNG